MRFAVAAMAAGAVVASLRVVLLADGLRKQIVEDHPTWPDDKVSSAFNGAVGYLLVFVGLWIWMAIANAQGRSWARGVAGALLFGKVLITFVNVRSRQYFGQVDLGSVPFALDLIETALGFVAFGLLDTGASERFYEQAGRWRTAQRMSRALPPATSRQDLLLLGLDGPTGTVDQGTMQSGPTESDLGAAFRQGRHLVAVSRYGEAEPALRYVISSGHPDYWPQAALQLGHLLVRVGRLEEAAAAYRIAVSSGHPIRRQAAAALDQLPST